MLSPGASRRALVPLLVGLALFTAALTSQGLQPIAETFGRAGGRVALLVPLFFLPLVVSSLGWGLLFERELRPRLRTLTYARWVGFAANQLLPVARVGGEIVRARIVLGGGVGRVEDLGQRAHPSMVAVVASLIVDKTAQVAAVAVFGLVGLGLFSARHVERDLLGPGLVGALLVALAGLAFYGAQRKGLVRWSGRLVGRVLSEHRRDAIRSTTDEVHRALSDLYQSGRPFLAILAHTLFRVGLAFELWLLARWFGHPLDYGAVLILEGMNQILRAATFMIPGSLGAQETGFLALGELLGVPAPLAFSLSLGKRVRELLVGVPALAVWQLDEARALRTKTRSSDR